MEDPKLLEALLEHILVHWDDIMACLIDELIGEEVLELNRIEGFSKPTSQHLADKTMTGKFHDFKSVDLREITSLFDEYKRAEERIIHHMNV